MAVPSMVVRERHVTGAFESARSRNALGSGTVERPWFCRELKELLTLPPGVEFCGWGPGRFVSTSRGPAPLAGAGAGAGWPCEDDISRVAAGSAFGCCLFFLPKRKDMAPVQALGQWRGRKCRSSTHSVATASSMSCTREGDMGDEAGWRCGGLVVHNAQGASGVAMDAERRAHVGGSR